MQPVAGTLARAAGIQAQTKLEQMGSFGPGIIPWRGGLPHDRAVHSIFDGMVGVNVGRWFTLVFLQASECVLWSMGMMGVWCQGREWCRDAMAMVSGMSEGTLQCMMLEMARVGGLQWVVVRWCGQLACVQQAGLQRQAQRGPKASGALNGCG